MKQVCVLLLFAASQAGSAAAAEPIEVGEEFVVAAAGPGKGIRGTPHLARGKDGYLAVWREGWNGVGGTARIHAARLGEQGQLLDPASIEIAPCQTGFQELPRVAFGGGVYLVVWQDFRNGVDYDVLGVRISTDGKILDNPPLAIATGPRTQSVPDVASDGANFLVAWQAVDGEENTFRVRTAAVGADGRVAAAAENVSPWTKSGSSPRLAWDGAHYRLTFVSHNLLTLRLNANGAAPAKEQVESLRGNLGTGIKFAHAVAAAKDQGMLAVCPRSQPDYWGWGGPGAMICIRVGIDGKKDATMPKESYPQSKLDNWLDFGKERKDGSPWPYGPCAVAWDGKQFVVVWQRFQIRQSVMLDNSDLLVSRVAGWRPRDAGVPLAASAFEERNPALAAGASGQLVCLYEKHARDGSIAIAARTLKTSAD